MNPKRFFLVMVVVLVLSIVAGAAGFWFGDRQLKARADSISDLTAQRDAAQKELDELQHLANTPVDQVGLESLIEAILPSEKQQQNLIANIIYTATGEAGISGSDISSISFTGSGSPDQLSGATKSKEVPDVYFYPFTVTIRNISYNTLLKLFQELEKNKRIIQVNEVQINPDKENPGQLSSVTLSLKTFIKP